MCVVFQSHDQKEAVRWGGQPAAGSRQCAWTFPQVHGHTADQTAFWEVFNMQTVTRVLVHHWHMWLHMVISIGLSALLKCVEHHGCKSSSFSVASSELDLCLQLKYSTARQLNCWKVVAAFGWRCCAYYILFMQIFRHTHTHTEYHIHRNTQEGNPLHNVLLCQHFFHCERLEAFLRMGVCVSMYVLPLCVCVRACV